MFKKGSVVSQISPKILQLIQSAKEILISEEKSKKMFLNEICGSMGMEIQITNNKIQVIQVIYLFIQSQ